MGDPVTCVWLFLLPLPWPFRAVWRHQEPTPGQRIKAAVRMIP